MSESLNLLFKITFFREIGRLNIIMHILLYPCHKAVYQNGKLPQKVRRWREHVSMGHFSIFPSVGGLGESTVLLSHANVEQFNITYVEGGPCFICQLLMGSLT